ncbi:YihY/virulence factor BrkB family protein [Paracidobacterium acidisoli]|uniref:YihY/virulence factor BrkB family protein n=1 Tax=Paracidobacterium acidisoli TaxID=2303751 RepID=A0A372IKU9_9BACT|nr:YihY/virulence factor BrkB family protein [Paracidobacterium acidisoli]MBT9332784.1 YihY/virulence factor BrkB family protein [Paracidobacterium acidisoli]
MSIAEPAPKKGPVLLHPRPPALPAGEWPLVVSLARYLSQSEVHTYAFSVAANAILSLFPFIVMMFTVAQRIFHSTAMTDVIGDMLRYFLPSNQDFVVRNMSLLVHPRGGVEVTSVVMLLISSSGVFLPLEVALNRVWGVDRHRSYLMNQLISLGLALAVGILALFSIALTAAQTRVLSILFFGHTQNMVFGFFEHVFLRISAAFLSVSLFFVIYWILPNRRLPVRAVVPAAITVGLLWEIAKIVYVAVLPWLDLRSVYGPFAVSVGLMIWAFLTGLLMLAGAHYSATRYTLRLAHQADIETAAEKPEAKKE